VRESECCADRGEEKMTEMSKLLSLSIILASALSSGAMTQQIDGTPGSPSATITIDGKQLPPPPLKFGGVMKESAKESQPWWPPRVVPPKGAPNVLLIMTDDQGYGVSGTFGGVIRRREYPSSTRSPRRFLTRCLIAA
jgi:hypothetical protein